MRIAFKLALDLSRSQIKAIKRMGIIHGLDSDDPAGRQLVKRVLAKIVDDGVCAIFASAPFRVDKPDEEPNGAPQEFGYAGPPGSAPAEDEPTPPPQPRRIRRSRPDANQAEAS